MKIPNTMPHLHNKNILILVCGSNSAYIYKTQNSICDLIDQISPQMLRLYRHVDSKAIIDIDFKGHAKSLNRPTRSVTQDRLIKLITEHLSNHIPGEAEELYIFCPQKISLKLIENIEALGRIKIEIARYGNYTKFHPGDLLKRVEQMMTSRLIV
ncbi:MAG: hypothetical protein P1P90_00470 [Patescibacteria group bacterium]|nr:hypothetical protein [Patescibacteria group bacterium]